MTERAISAPGKLFVSGEYAVLWGGVARVAAVAPRVAAYVRTRDDRRVDIVLEEGRLSGTATHAGVKWAAVVPPEFRFVAHAIDLAYRVGGHDGPGFGVAFESSPTSRGRKLGFGSSARAAVLAAEAARSALGGTFDSFKLALLTHADAQKGKGSGADVAACFAGGLTRYRRYPIEALLKAANTSGLSSALADSAPVDVLRTPELTQPMLYAFSGTSASTTALIADVERNWPIERRARFVEESDGLGSQLEQALIRRDFAAVIEACNALQALLWSLGVTHSDGLERILALAATFGCTGKQSGAGGGDGALLFAPDDDARQTLLTALTERNIFAMPVSCSPGLQGEATAPPALSLWLQAGWSS
jgi:phosphomevalonate kinase